ncbi:hypothetical protein vseg_014942 [Gypsophila vaccaria]
MSYYGRLKKLWDDLQACDTLPTCTCTGCRCDVVTKLSTRREEERVRDFLMGLDPCFATIRSHILRMGPLPNLNHVYNMLVQEEGVNQFTQRTLDSKPEPLAFAARVQEGNLNA